MYITPPKAIDAIKKQLTNNDGIDMAGKVHRCLCLLDLIDSAIITSGTFSTPFDHALEQLRAELNAMLRAVGHSSQVHASTVNH